MYNTILQTSLLLFGSDTKTIRFESNMLRSLGIRSIRGIIDIEGYLGNMRVYPMVDAFLIHEYCTPYTGIEFIERLRLEHNCVSPIILVLSSPPSASLMQTLESLSGVALVRPYTRRDVQRALVQSKRVITDQGTVEELYYRRAEDKIKHNKEISDRLPVEKSRTFLMSMIQFQFFLRSGEYEKAGERLFNICDAMPIHSLLSLVDRTAQESSNKIESIHKLCGVISKRDKRLAHTIGSSLLEGYEQKLTIKKISERKARVVGKDHVPVMYKNIQ